MPTKTLQPLNDFVLVKALPKDEKIGGIYVPESARTSSNEVTATVIAVGPAARADDDSPMLEAGDVVVFEAHFGHTVRSTGEVLLILKARDIWGVLSATE